LKFFKYVKDYKRSYSPRLYFLYKEL
jgi:hypothetical protein